MNFKPLFVILLLAMALSMVAEVSAEFDFNGVVGDFIGDDNEMLMDSEANRRTLAAQKRYVSYGALRANQVPCGNRGRSYYNCQQRGRANPYRRGCNAITHCARDTS